MSNHRVFKVSLNPRKASGVSQKSKACVGVPIKMATEEGSSILQRKEIVSTYPHKLVSAGKDSIEFFD
jgi:hypothetical protein